MKLPTRQPARPSATESRATEARIDLQAGLVPQADALCCAALCSGKAGYAACLARCLLTGQACDGGVSNCTPGC